jgi:cell division protein FtsX
MRIVGASSMHVELPFIMEALFYGIIAFFISLLPYSFMKTKFIPVLAGQFNVDPSLFYIGFAAYIQQWWLIIFLGVLIFNTLSSWLVVKEYVSKKIVL